MRETFFRPNPDTASKQNVAYTDTAGTITNAVGKTGVYRIYCTSDAHIKIGASATATTDDMPVTAKTATDIVLLSDDKVSAIQQSQGGTLYVQRMDVY